MTNFFQIKIVPFIKAIRLKNYRYIVPLMFAIFISLSLPACKNKNPEPTSTTCTICEARKEIKHYFLFDLGSWWVYEEETTHDRDSIYVVASLNDNNSSDFECRVFSSYQNHYYHFFPVITVSSPSTGCSDDAITTKKCIYIKSSKYFPGAMDGGEEICFFSQYYLGANTSAINVQYPNSQVTFSQLFDNYDLGNLSFGKTLKVHVDHSVLEHNSPTNNYYVKGVGLIRKEIIDSNQVWNLVDYHVTQ